VTRAVVWPAVLTPVIDDESALPVTPDAIGRPSGPSEGAATVLWPGTLMIPGIDEGVEVARAIVVIAEPSVPYEVESAVMSAERSVPPEVDGMVEIAEVFVATGNPSGPVDAAGNKVLADDASVASPGSTVEPGDSVAPTTPFWARLKLIRLDSASCMVDELSFGTKVVFRLLSPKGRFVTNGGGIVLVSSTGWVLTVTPGILELITEPLAANVGFEIGDSTPGVEAGRLPVVSPRNVVVLIEPEMPESVVATEDNTEVMTADPIPGSIIVDCAPVISEDITEPVVLIPIAPLMMVDSIWWSAMISIRGDGAYTCLCSRDARGDHARYRPGGRHSGSLAW
jgi:hypothetical protein